MKTYPKLIDVPSSAVLIQAQIDGTWLAYFPGDELPVPDIVVIAPANYVTVSDFRTRFTQAELIGILSSQDAGVKLLLLEVTTASPNGVDLLSARVQGGLSYLVGLGLLTADRAAVIGA